MINKILPAAIITSLIDSPNENNESPIKYLDNDILTVILPEYVAKMRKKVWWENLLNTIIRCYKGDLSCDWTLVHILDNKFPLKQSINKCKLFSFSPVLSQCEDRLETLFIKEYGCSYKNPIPKMDVDFIPFYNLFMKLVGYFDSAMLSDYRLSDRYINLKNYFNYLRYTDNPYIKEIKKNNNLRFAFKNHAFFNMKTNYNKLYMIKNLFNIDIDERDFKENREFIKEKCQEIKELRKSIVPYTKKLTDKDKEIMIESLNNYYYVINTVKSLDPWYPYYYDLDQNMKRIKKNIEKIKSM